MTQQEGWGGVLHQRIAAAIRNAREGRMSAQELADETARLGYPVSRSQIANYESGRKQSLDVADLLVLAAALNIPPGLLLFPGYPEGAVEFLPGRTADASAALDWFSGEGRLPAEPGPEGGPLRVILPSDGIELVRLVRERGETAQVLFLLESRSLMKKTKEATRRLLDAEMRNLEEQLAELQEQIDKLSPTFEVEEKPR